MPDFSFREWFCSRWPPKPSQRYSIYFTVLKYRTFYKKKIQFSAANFIFFISLGHEADWISTSPRTVFEINNMYICMNKRIVPIHPKVFFVEPTYSLSVSSKMNMEKSSRISSLFAQIQTLGIISNLVGVQHIWTKLYKSIEQIYLNPYANYKAFVLKLQQQTKWM